MGIIAKIILLTALSSRMPTGTPVQARVTESGRGISAGSVLTGHLIAQRARWFHKSGKLRIDWDSITNQQHVPVLYKSNFRGMEVVDYAFDPHAIMTRAVLSPGVEVDAEGEVTPH